MRQGQTLACYILLVLLLVLCCLGDYLVSSKVGPKPFHIISTVAGGSVGDGLRASDAFLQQPYCVKIHPVSGDMFIADYADRRIRKISSTTGIMSTMAGTGVTGNGEGGGLAVETNIGQPRAVDVDPRNGDVYFADSYEVIRKVFANGTITKVAGSGTYGACVDGTLALACSFSTVSSVAVHPVSGEIYFAEADNYLVRKISNNLVVTVAGGGQNVNDGGLATSAYIEYPAFVTFNSVGEMFIGENARVRKVFLNGTITTIAGTGVFGYSGDYGLAINAQIEYVPGIALNQEGDVIITDSSNNRIRKIMTNGTIVTIAGNGQSGYTTGGVAIETISQEPYCVASGLNGELYICDHRYGRITRVSPDGYLSIYSGDKVGDGYANTKSKLNGPINVFTQGGDLLISDNSRIRKISNGVINTLVGSPITGYNGNALLGNETQVYRPLGFASTNTSNVFNGGVVNNGEIYFADVGNYRIRKILTNGTILNVAGNGLGAFSEDGLSAFTSSISPQSIAFNSDGELVYSDVQNHRIRKIANNGSIITIAGTGRNGIQGGGFSGDGGPARNARINNPYFFIINSAGEILISDVGNYRIRKVMTNGTITTIAGTGSTSGSVDGGLASQISLLPYAIGLNSREEIIFTESSTHRVRMIKSDGTVTTIAGIKSSFGNTGDGGLASNAQLANPKGLAVDSQDAIYVVTVGSNTIRKISPMCNQSYVLVDGECISFCFGISGNDSARVCSGHGLCDEPNSCICDSNGYYGMNCELFNCSGIPSNASNVCSSHGSCVQPNNCTCQEGFYGMNCELFNCYGIPSNASNVCSSHGSCVQPNNCTCSNNYYGMNCELFNCYGVMSNSSHVCSNHGSCLQPNNCTCSYNYYGMNCELYQCSGIPSNASNVCSSHGSCLQPNNCTCSNNYYGMNCELFNCSGIPSNASNVCSSHGSCIASNNCSCLQGYYGMNCDLFNCFNVEHLNKTFVCSGHGTCSSPNNCSCSTGYKGSNCETLIVVATSASTGKGGNTNNGCVNGKNSTRCSFATRHYNNTLFGLVIGIMILCFLFAMQ